MFADDHVSECVSFYRNSFKLKTAITINGNEQTTSNS